MKTMDLTQAVGRLAAKYPGRNLRGPLMFDPAYSPLEIFEHLESLRFNRDLPKGRYIVSVDKIYSVSEKGFLSALPIYRVAR